MNLKEELKKEVNKLGKEYKELEEKFNAYINGLITQKELEEMIDKDNIIYRKKELEIKNIVPNDFFKEVTEKINEGYSVLQFNFRVFLSNSLDVESVELYKEEPQRLILKQSLILEKITRIIQEKLNTYAISIDCNVLKSFLNEEINEETFKKLIQIGCDLED